MLLGKYELELSSSLMAFNSGIFSEHILPKYAIDVAGIKEI